MDSGLRDQFRTRVERTATGSEVYIIHRGLEEVYVGDRRESTTWRPRANDPQLEADSLARLMVSLGAKDDVARTAVASAVQPATRVTAPDGSPAAATATSLLVDEPFDRAWRRVGLALDRGGFTVEDRDRASGLYYVRYIDPKNVGKDEPGWFAKLFGDKSNPQAALRYRIQLKASGTKTSLTVQDSTGTVDTGENAQRIVGLLTTELR
jgi:outer membrane protein assembly factor BamC